MDARVYLEDGGLYVAVEPLTEHRIEGWAWAYRLAAEVLEQEIAPPAHVRVASYSIDGTPRLRVRYHESEGFSANALAIKRRLEDLVVRIGGG